MKSSRYDDSDRYINNYLMKRGNGRIDEAERRQEVMLLVGKIADELKSVSTIGEVSYYVAMLNLVISGELTGNIKTLGMIQSFISEICDYE